MDIPYEVGFSLEADDIYSQRRFLVVEVDESTLSAMLAPHQELSLKGNPSDASVLCFRDSTFDLRQVETSNTMLLVSNDSIVESRFLSSSDSKVDDASVRIRGSFSRVCELCRTRPHIEEITALLLECPYDGSLDELATLSGNHSSSSNDMSSKQRKRRKYSLQEIMDSVRASDVEVMSCLDTLHAFEYEGAMRILDPAFRASLFLSILNLCVAEQLEIDLLDISSLSRLSDEHPRIVLRACLSSYGHSVDGTSSLEADCWKLDRDQISRFHADLLLQGFGNQDVLEDEFLRAWDDAMPITFGCRSDLSLIQDFSVVYESRSQRVVRYVPQSSLPNDFKQRIRSLFQIKKKWTLDELEPLLQPVLEPGQQIEAAIRPYIRVSQDPKLPTRVWYNAK